LILLDTHIWVWWVSNPDKLSRAYRELLSSAEERAAISAISCWEVAKLVEYGRLQLDRKLPEWMDAALSISNLTLLPLTPAIAIESTCLPGQFHRDPADQLIVATARIHGLAILTEDDKIVQYPHVSSKV
jgi:PIN domain nuclease of toxin-antitoxin system